MSNEKVVTWLNFSTTSPYFCEPLSVQHIEIKMNVPNVWGRQTNTFDFLVMFGKSLTFSANDEHHGKTKDSHSLP